MSWSRDQEQVTYRCDEQGVGGLVEEHEGIAAGELREHEAGRVWRPVPQRLVGLDDEDHLVGALGQPVLLAQPPQVVQHTLEQTEYLVLCRERPDERKIKICCQQLLDGAHMVPGLFPNYEIIRSTQKPTTSESGMLNSRGVCFCLVPCGFSNSRMTQGHVPSEFRLIRWNLTWCKDAPNMED